MRHAVTLLALAAATALGVTPATAADTTTISVSVDCRGCEVRAINATSYFRSDGRESPYYRSAKVRNGRAELRVATRKTRGMAFVVADMPYDLGGGLPTVVLKRTGNRGSWCWAGTRAKRVTLKIATKRWVDTSVPEAAPGHYQLAVWADPPVNTYRDGRNMQRLRQGGLATQNYPRCR